MIIFLIDSVIFILFGIFLIFFLYSMLFSSILYLPTTVFYNLLDLILRSISIAFISSISIIAINILSAVSILSSRFHFSRLIYSIIFFLYQIRMLIYKDYFSSMSFSILSLFILYSMMYSDTYILQSYSIAKQQKGYLQIFEDYGKSFLAKVMFIAYKRRLIFGIYMLVVMHFIFDDDTVALIYPNTIVNMNSILLSFFNIVKKGGMLGLDQIAQINLVNIVIGAIGSLFFISYRLLSRIEAQNECNN